MSAKVFTWVHVSDWHFKSTGNDALMTAIEDIPRAVTSLLGKRTIDCIVHSGDVANGGKTPEYSAAQGALAKLANGLGVSSENVIITPGNHDVFNDAAFYPAELKRFKDEAEYVAAQEQWLSRERLRKILLERFEHFHRFKKDNKYPGHCEDTNAWFTHLVSFGKDRDSQVCFTAVNSSLVSTRLDREVEAELILGRWRMDHIVKELQAPQYQDAERHVLVLHHPLAFLNERDALRCWEVIEDHFDVVLCGHKHGKREIWEHFAMASGLPVIDAGSLFPSKKHKKLVETAEFAIGQFFLDSPPTGRIEISYFAWNKRKSQFEKNNKLGELGVPVPHGPLTFPLPHPQKVKRSKQPPAIIIHGSTDAGQHYQRSARIIENLYAQRTDSDHQSENNSPKPKLILPTKHFFWHVESRSLFECMASRHEYWLRTESRKIFNEHQDKMVSTVVEQTKGHASLLVAVLGVGNGNKEVEFYTKLKSKRAELKRSLSTSLLFIDINYQMILRAANNAAKKAVSAAEVRFSNVDFDDLSVSHLSDHPIVEEKSKTANACPVLFLLLGNTFANQFETRLLNQLRGLGSNIWLLFDVPLLSKSKRKQTDGYGTDAAKEFKELTLRHFDKRYERKWRMRQADRIVPKIVKSQISDVNEAETISNVANSPTFGRLWMGMSHRYKQEKLEEFFVHESWRMVPWSFAQNGSECRYYLIQPNGAPVATTSASP